MFLLCMYMYVLTLLVHLYEVKECLCDTPGAFGPAARPRAQLVGHLTHKSEVLGLIPGLATYFSFSFC